MNASPFGCVNCCDTFYYSFLKMGTETVSTRLSFLIDAKPPAPKDIFFSTKSTRNEMLYRRLVFENIWHRRNITLQNCFSFVLRVVISAIVASEFSRGGEGGGTVKSCAPRRTLTHCSSHSSYHFESPGPGTSQCNKTFSSFLVAKDMKIAVQAFIWFPAMPIRLVWLR